MDLAEVWRQTLALMGPGHSHEGLEGAVEIRRGARRISRDDRVGYPARVARCRHETPPDLAANAPNPAEPLDPGCEAHRAPEARRRGSLRRASLQRDDAAHKIGPPIREAIRHRGAEGMGHEDGSAHAECIEHGGYTVRLRGEGVIAVLRSRRRPDTERLDYDHSIARLREAGDDVAKSELRPEETGDQDDRRAVSGYTDLQRLSSSDRDSKGNC